MKNFLTLSILLSIVLMANRGQATTYTPTIFTDPAVSGGVNSANGVITGGAGNGQVSLRSAVIAANAHAGADIITLPAGTYTLALVGNDSTCQAGDLDINGSLTINGAGPATTIVQGATDAAFTGSIGDKIFGINQDGTFTNLTVLLSGMTIRYGRNTVPYNDPSFAYTGAGIDVFMTGTGNSITISNCVITGNENVNSYGGGINIDSGNSGLPGDPAANTVNRGTVTIVQCTIANNKSKMMGAGANLFADIHNVVFNNCVISNNVTTGLGGVGASGGGLNLRHTYGGSVIVSNNTFIVNNTGIGWGGGVSVSAPHLGPVTIQNSTISGNTVLNAGAVSSEGGGLYNEGLATILTNVVVANNHADTFGTGGSPENPEGGGVLIDYGSLTITGNSYITNNTSVDGAGIFNRTANSTNSVTGATIAGNLAKNNGGGVCVLNGVMTLSTSTLLNNIANSDSTGGGDGGAIAVRGGTLNASFCRVISNTAANGNAVARSAGTATVTNIWWGTNNPASLMNGTVGFTPWLQLAHTANPSTIFVPNSTTLTATFLTNSAGTAIPVANLSLLIGLPITFNNAVRGALSGAQTTIQSSGTATATFTASAAGAGSADAVVDNQATTASITIPTGVSSINRVQTSPTNLTSVSWTVTFTNGVSGVAAANFSLVNGGLGGSPGISSVVAVGATPANSWTVTASTGSGTGTLGLNMVNGTSVSAVIVNLPFTGEVYTIDLVAPDTSITAQPPSLTNSASASFSFTGSDTGVGVAGFQYQLDGAAYATGTSPVNFTGLSEASHTFNVRAVDGAGNIDASPASVTWTVDTTPPSIAISAPSASTLHFGGFANYTVTYADTHFNSSTLTAGNVTLNKTGSADGTVVVAGSGTTRTVTVTNVSGSGTIGISIAAGTATDTASNAAPAAGPSSTFSVVEDDFGDAPAPYPTLLVDNGARHTIPIGGAILFLGTEPPDGETNGQPNATATGDNLAGVNDEDGVTFPASFRGGLSSNITVTVTGSGGLLNAWIDWNHDGDWSDAGEQVCSNLAVSAGANVIAILAPGSNTVSAVSFARFRLSSQSNLLPTGQAPDGEVEDYAVTLISNTPPVAVNDTLGTLQNRAVSMTASKLAANDTDADGDALTVSAVSATSTNGGSAVLSSGTITYTPLPALAGTDRFTYTVSDGRDGTSVGTVVVTVTSSNAVSLNVVYGPVIDGTDFVVRFAGVPGETFTVEATDTLSPPLWVKKTNLTAPTSPGAFGVGVFEYREPIGTSGFYRTVYPSY